jgi:hypothetical protein
VRVDGEPDIHYTILRNKSYRSLSSLLDSGDNSQRDPENDTYTVIRGFSGSYPNFFLVVDLEQLEEAMYEFRTVRSLEDYQKLVAKYGIRRTNPEFWEHSDWFHKKYAEQRPLEWGAFDLNRYGNF